MSKLTWTIASLLIVSSAAAQENIPRALECQSRLRAANEAGIIHDLSLKPGEIRLVVDLQTWRSIDFKTKTGLVETVVCMFTAGDRNKTAFVNVYDHIDNRLVGKYDGRSLSVP